MEHTVSDLFVERLDKLLGFPKTCPHGGTIPANGELLVEINNLPLADIKEAGAYRLTRVHDSFDILNYLDKHSLHIGDSLQVKQFDGFSNTFTILSKDEDLQVSMDICKTTLCRKNQLISQVPLPTLKVLFSGFYFYHLILLSFNCRIFVKKER